MPVFFSARLGLARPPLEDKLDWYRRAVAADCLLAEALAFVVPLRARRKPEADLGRLIPDADLGRFASDADASPTRTSIPLPNLKTAGATAVGLFFFLRPF